MTHLLAHYEPFRLCPQNQGKTKIHSLVAERKSKELKESWDLTQKILLKDVESTDYRAIMNALFSFIGIGNSEILPILINTLGKHGNKMMAEAYLNCGSNELYRAGRDWASRHDYRILSGKGSSPIGWGKM
ncbi:MAG: hypothetical protein NPIRA05_12160 [Nitrospirales bacterium]|nr:MAG: hypothetical protein NPIRA05_12160 [Nitrospirales bacterium]